MRIKVSVGFLALICFLGWLNLPVCGYFLFGMIVHEVGHLLALRLCGVQIKHLELKVTGAVIDAGWMSYQKELICAGAGPCTSILLCVCTLRAAPGLSMTSLALAVVNLLPLLPLDGGRMLRACLMMVCRQETAETVLHWVTTATCLGMMLLACWGTIQLQAGVWPIFLALLLLWKVGEQEK